ncbi:MAG: IclR family transcriptional regulator [Actinomycetaceae bacterium]
MSEDLRSPARPVDARVGAESAGPSSIGNALRLLQMFRARREVRVTDAAKELGVARSTAHRFLQILTMHGYAVQSESRAYRAGPALLGLAVSLADDLDLRTVAAPIMGELVADLGETVHLSVLHERRIVFVHSVETTRGLRVGVRTGSSLPAHATAAGRVLLAHLPDEDDRRRPPGAGWAAVTNATETDPDRIEDLLAEARRDGWSTSYGETEEDVASVAVPVLDSDGHVLAALALSAPPSRLPPGTIHDTAAALTAGARRISEVLPSVR